MRSATPTPRGSGGLIQPAPMVQSRNAYHHQNAPYEVKATAPKVFPFLNSMMPATICAKPPNENARGTTAGRASPGSNPALMQLRTTVVTPKQARPNGPGFATLTSAMIKFLHSGLNRGVLGPGHQRSLSFICV